MASVAQKAGEEMELTKPFYLSVYLFIRSFFGGTKV
jgi:hypothetical protein